MLPEDKSYYLFIRELLEHGSLVGIDFFLLLKSKTSCTFSLFQLALQKVYFLTAIQALS